MAFVNLSDIKDYDAVSTASRTTVSSEFRVKNPKKLPRLNDRFICVTCSGFTVTGRPCKNPTLNRSGYCQTHETREIKSEAFLQMCDDLLEAVEHLPNKIPKIPIPDEAIVDEIPTAIPTTTPANQIHIHYNLFDLMKQINIFIAYCIIMLVVYMYMKSMHVSDELVCLPAPRRAPTPPSLMLS
jgi:hypothetical protein